MIDAFNCSTTSLKICLHSSYQLPVLYFGDWRTGTDFGQNMVEHKLELTEYRDSKDEGYRAQVEQAVLARAEILVMVGGGSFERQTYNRY